MEIKKFEAYNYRGPALKDMTRQVIIEELVSSLTGEKFIGYEVNGTTYFHQDEVAWLHIDKEENGKYLDSKILKIDLSDLGIEIGTAEWNSDEEEFGEFIPELNLDTETTKQMKNYKKTIKKFNL